MKQASGSDESYNSYSLTLRDTSRSEAGNLWGAGLPLGRRTNRRQLCNVNQQNAIQTKHQLDATLCRFYFCRVTTCFGRKRPTSGVFKTTTAATGTCVIVAGKSSHLLIRTGRRCDDLPATITHVPVAAVVVLNTPDVGRLRPKHVVTLQK